MKIETKFDIEEIVILKTDPHKDKRIITNITINPNGVPRYALSCGDKDSSHYEFEIERVCEKTIGGFRP